MMVRSVELQVISLIILFTLRDRKKLSLPTVLESSIKKVDK